MEQLDRALGCVKVSRMQRVVHWARVGDWRWLRLDYLRDRVSRYWDRLGISVEDG